MISINKVIGTFENVTTEQEIVIPAAAKIVFAVDAVGMMISINDNLHYMLYKNTDGIFEFVNDSANSLSINKIYIKAQNIGFISGVRIWAEV